MHDDERTPALQRPRDATRQLVNDDNTVDNTIDNDSDDNDEQTPIVYYQRVQQKSNDVERCYIALSPGSYGDSKAISSAIVYWQRLQEKRKQQNTGWIGRL